MNLKFSQFPRLTNITDSDIIPVLRYNNNYALSASAIYKYLSGDNSRDVYTSYKTYSSLFLTNVDTTSSLFSTYSTNSSYYVTINTRQSISGIKTFLEPVNFVSSLSAFTIYTANGDSNKWNQAYSNISTNSAKFVNTFNTLCSLSGNWNDTYSIMTNLSSNAIISDTTFVPGASAIKNIILLTQTAYDNLLLIDPNTLYFVHYE